MQVAGYDIRSSLIVLVCIIVCAMGYGAKGETWQPPSGYMQTPIWPENFTIDHPSTIEAEGTKPGKTTVAGLPWTEVSNVSRPTMTIYRPVGKNTGAAVVVLPGGGYRILAIDLEGTEVCDWLVLKGITCVVLKYRVPGSGPWWDPQCNCRKIPKIPMALQDTQRAIALLRHQAGKFGINPHKIGVLGFSAGGHIVASVSTRLDRAYTAVDEADAESFRPDFAIALYPGHLWAEADLTLAPDIKVTHETPPTFLLHAEDDPVDDVRHSLAYYTALNEAKVPVEMHLYAKGGHAFGLRRTTQPITHWPDLVDKWLHTIGILP